MQRGAAGVATTPRQSFKRSRMRIKFEAVDKNGKLHKRASEWFAAGWNGLRIFVFARHRVARRERRG